MWVDGQWVDCQTVAVSKQQQQQLKKKKRGGEEDIFLICDGYDDAYDYTETRIHTHTADLDHT